MVQIVMAGSELSDLPEAQAHERPYDGIGWLKMFDAVGDPVPRDQGTCIVIGENHVLTAAHNLWDEKRRREYAIVKVQAGMFMGESTQWFFPEELKQMNDFPIALDYGVIAFKDDPFDRAQILSLGDLKTMEVRLRKVLIPGWKDADPEHPDKGERCLAAAPEQYLNAVSDAELQYRISTVRGMSGAPVLQRQDEQSPYVVIGVHAHSTEPPPMNHGARLNRLALDRIKFWMEQPIRGRFTRWAGGTPA